MCNQAGKKLRVRIDKREIEPIQSDLEERCVLPGYFYEDCDNKLL
jgi:hypothetical protein